MIIPSKKWTRTAEGDWTYGCYIAVKQWGGSSNDYALYHVNGDNPLLLGTLVECQHEVEEREKP